MAWVGMQNRPIYGHHHRALTRCQKGLSFWRRGHRGRCLATLRNSLWSVYPLYRQPVNSECFWYCNKCNRLIVRKIQKWTAIRISTSLIRNTCNCIEWNPFLFMYFSWLSDGEGILIWVPSTAPITFGKPHFITNWSLIYWISLASGQAMIFDLK